MSSSLIESLVLPEDIIRDFLFTHDGTAVPLLFDVGQSFSIVGLDLFIRNRGAANITVAVNGQAAITVDPGDVYTLNGVKFWLVTIASAVIYDCQIFGVRYNTLKRRGLL